MLYDLVSGDKKSDAAIFYFLYLVVNLRRICVWCAKFINIQEDAMKE